ncbi:MAG: hypothetical protein U9Q98_00260 [Bacteroidota bacterium]|nr:hypothetical protein [Bacteroidota bacterium]
MKLYKRILFIITAVILLLSCSDEWHENRTENKLVQHEWLLYMYVDGVENQVVELDSTVYVFEKDGVFIQKRNENQVVESTWELLDQKYVRVASAVFKINTLTNGILSLEYGEDILYFVPVD